MDKSRGILILALGKPRYGNLAAMLAVTIKARNPNAQIAVVHSGDALSELNKDTLDLFDGIIPAPAELVQPGQYMLTKLYLDILTPFDQTLYLDADTSWHYTKSLASLFDFWQEITKQSGIQPQVYNYVKAPRYYRNRGRYTYWCNTTGTGVKLHKYLSNNWYCVSSTFLYFDNTHPKCIASFENARRLLAAKEQLVIERISGKYPDEYFLGLGMCMAGVELSKTDWAPIYFSFIHANLPEEFVQTNFYGITPTGGDAKKAITLYNKEVKQACAKLGITPIYWQQK